MRDHTLKEVAFYNHLFRVPSVFTPAIDTKVGLQRRMAWAGWGQPLHIESEIPSVSSGPQIFT
jgi:cytoplasmic tRNA 2-thiolation protein 2